MNKGFTLVELLITITIIGVMASVAMPSFAEFVALTQVKTDASNLHLSLMRTRSEAIKRNTSVTITGAGGSGGWKYGWTISGGLETQGPIKATTSISGPASVTYNANGRATGGAVQFEVSSSKTAQKRCITLNLSGQPAVKTC